MSWFDKEYTQDQIDEVYKNMFIANEIWKSKNTCQQIHFMTVSTMFSTLETSTYFTPEGIRLPVPNSGVMKTQCYCGAYYEPTEEELAEYKANHKENK